MKNIIPVIEKFKEIKEVKAIALAGSRTAKSADEKSDYDIYIYSDKEIDLSLCTLQDDKGSAEEYIFPEGTKIPAGGFLVLEQDASFTFGISSSNGDEISLFDSKGNLIDKMAVPVMEDGKSYGRLTDGGSQTGIMANPTKGAANDSTPGDDSQEPENPDTPVNPAERVYYPVADNEKPIVAFGSDKEQDKYVAQIMFKYDALPDSLKGTMADVTTSYLLDMAQMMLQIRLNELGQKADAPFAVASAFYGEFIMAKTKQAFQMAMVPKGNSFDEGLKAVYREALRAKRGGFTATEYARCRTEYLSQLEKAYNNRNQQENKTLAESYVRNFIDKKPIPGIETEYQMMSMIVNQIPVEAVNQVFSQIVSDKNLVVLGMMPAREGESCPKDEDILALLSQVEAENIAPYVDNVKDEPLVSELPAAGKVVKENMLSDFGAKEWILSNGAKVILKKTDFKADEINMMAVAKGGTSVYGNDKAADLMFMPAVLEQHGLGNFTNSDLTKLMAGKQVSLKVAFEDYVRSLYGNTTPKDLKTYMEMIYMTFTGLTVTEDEFAAMQNLYKGLIQNQEQNPSFVFQKKVQEFLYTSPNKQVFGVSDIEKANRDNILSIIHEQLANAADFTFVFSGNFDETELKTLVEQYIASLPSVKGKKQELKYNSAVEIKSGSEEKDFTMKMEVPQGSAAVIISGKMPYSFKNRLMASMSAQIISTRLLNEVREKEGAVYSIYTQGSQNRLSEVSVVSHISDYIPG